MKSKNISIFVVEGVDGVGKTTLYNSLLKKFNYVYSVYDRGELSNFVYAKKYNRLFSSNQRNLPILYILLYCDEYELKNRIISRGIKEKWTEKEIEEELEKIKDQKIFLENVKSFNKDYHLILINNTNLSSEETSNLAEKKINEYLNKLNKDLTETYSNWNNIYSNECDKLGLSFKVIDNQPYINNIPIMAECNLHNGVYETFTDKRIPHNLIYCQSYTQNPNVLDNEFRNEDFVYVINSKILTRNELYDYFNSFIENNMSCIVGTSQYSLSDPFLKNSNRVFGDEYIKLISNAKATVYVGRNLEYLKYTSTRLYESILAKNIIFVDTKSDLDNSILTQIHNECTYDNIKLKDLLYVDEKNICSKYKYIIQHKELVNMIIDNQSNYYNKLKEVVLEKIKKEGISL